jgi:predicted transcriptional regulator
MVKNSPYTNIYELIKTKPGITGREIRDILPDMARRTIFTYTNQLIKDGLVIKVNALRDARMFKYYPVK